MDEIKQKGDAVSANIDTVDTTLDLSAQRDFECVPVIRKIMLAIAQSEDLMIGTAGMEEDALSASYLKLYNEIIVPIFEEANLKISDTKYVFSVAMQPFQLLNDITSNSINHNLDKAEQKLWKVKDTRELRISDVDKVLKASV
jgi:hypothetical protein